MANKDKFLKGSTSMSTLSGSKAPMDAAEGKWFDGVDAANLDRLSKIADDVAKTMDEAVTQLSRAKLKIGKMLNEAREVFKGDKEFGQWRVKAIPNMSATDATYCMKAAATFGSAPELIDKIGWSVMRELVYAPPVLLNRIQSGEVEIPTTKAETRQMVSDSRDTSPPLSAATDGPVVVDADYTYVEDADGPPEATEKAEVSSPPAGQKKIRVGNKEYPPLTMEQKWMYYLSLNVEGRVQHGAEFGFDPFITLGLPPDSEAQLMSRDALNALVNGYYSDPALSQGTIAAIKGAAKDVLEIINDSFEPLIEERVPERFRAERD
jgi:hypothetical protein